MRLKLTLFFTLVFLITNIFLVPFIQNAHDSYIQEQKVYDAVTKLNGGTEPAQNGPSLWASFYGSARLWFLRARENIGALSWMELMRWIVSTLAIFFLSSLCGMFLGKHLSGISKRLDALAAGDFNSKMSRKGLFSQITRTLNNTSEKLKEREAALQTKLSENIRLNNLLLEQLRVNLSECRGHLSVLSDSGAIPAENHEKALLIGAQEKLEASERLIMTSLADHEPHI